jgi:ABC-type lipoprotein release transport system permease subunit
MIIWKTAWKNVWRNRSRSLVVIASVTVGIFAGVFAVAFMNGMIAQRFNGAIDEEISHIQISGKNFSLNNDPGIIIPSADSLASAAITIPGIEGATERKILTGMAATAAKSAGVQIVGINPEIEKTIFSLHETIIPGTGDYFERQSKFDLALIGQELAKELNIIRYSIDSTVAGRLSALNVPDDITEKLKPLYGKRLPNEKKFSSAVGSLLSNAEQRKYMHLIRGQSWTFRENSRMTLTFLDVNNNQVSAVFRIAGIFDTKNSVFEQSAVFVENNVLSRLSGLGERDFHQVIIRINDIENTENLTSGFRNSYPSLEVKSWKDIQPDLAMMTDYVHQIYGLFMAIILAALAFGIINTMLMAVLERTKELGMLTAIGMNKRRVFSMIMLESVFLSLTGGGSGMAVGWLTVLLTSQKGISMASYAEGLEAFGYSAQVYPEISFGFFVIVTVMIIVTGVLSSVYPALKALRLDPADAIRTE